MVILRAISHDTHPAKVNLAFTSKIGAEVMVARFLDLVLGKVCLLLLLQFAGERGVHSPELPWKTAILEPPYEAGSCDTPQSKLCPSYKPQVSHFDHSSLVQPLMAATQLMSYKARDPPTEPTGTWEIAQACALVGLIHNKRHL